MLMAERPRVGIHISERVPYTPRRSAILGEQGQLSQRLALCVDRTMQRGGGGDGRRDIVVSRGIDNQERTLAADFIVV